MKTHLSQPIGVGAFGGQHGMSPAMSSVISDADISSAIDGIDMSDDVMLDDAMSGELAAITGRETGAKAKPATTRIASSRRMARQRFTELGSRDLVATARQPRSSYHESPPAAIDRHQGGKPALSPG